MTYFGDASAPEAGSEDADLDAQEVEEDTSDHGYDIDIDDHLDGHLDIDADLDAAIDDVSDGGQSVRPVVTAESLPLAMSTRDAFLHARDVPVTGDARVDAATARLTELVDLPTSDHAAVYDDVHRRLQDALADADQR
ncbi:MAG: hypothetical protein WCP81_03540 [Actinomycetes bacterium]